MVDATVARRLADELAAALATIPAPAPVDVSQDGQNDETAPSPTGWDDEMTALAGRLTRLASAISGHVRDHQAATADWRHATQR
ncbi:hypothetical protein [Nonomuraea dietziae]|uniref:hypothetical protein n=1 Tax=Nonomuraea dietziae TaxID=65515 RepID=UPI0034265FA0